MDVKGLAQFQSTPPRGWRPMLLLTSMVFPYFNPLHREGGDYFGCLCLDTLDISIHSTARVETFTLCFFIPLYGNFNPLHREGGDCRERIRFPVRFIFQSTPPRGWRRRRAVLVALFIIFQSTPPRGWRRCRQAVRGGLQDFNPLHREGGDGGNVRKIFLQQDFNPLHREGGDESQSICNERDWDFNPLHREGGDLAGSNPVCSIGYFNPLHREGGDL